MNPNDQAFPRTWAEERGMTLREYFSAHAMQGILASGHAPYPVNPTFTAEQAVKHADALIAELSK